MTDPTTTHVPRCGDTVLHRPSGENWIVAYADPAQDIIAWAGWPNGIARLSDCVLTLAVSDEQHLAAVDVWRHAVFDDGRRSRVLRLYGTPEARHGR